MLQVFCGKCRHYRGDEKISNPKSMAWFDSSRPKCAIDKSRDKKDYRCRYYESNTTEEKPRQEMKCLQY